MSLVRTRMDAADAADEIRRSWMAEDGTGEAASQALRSLRTAVAAWSEQFRTSSLRTPTLTAEGAQVFGTALATLAHITLQSAAHQSTNPGPGTSSRSATSGYLHRLSRLRDIAVDGEVDHVSDLLHELAMEQMATLISAWETAPSASSTLVADGAKRVELAHTSRRVTALIAVCPLIQYRANSSRLRGSTGALAQRRTRLVRRASMRGRSRFDHLPPLARTTVLGRTSDVAFVDRPDRPYTRLRLTVDADLRVHFKNLLRCGLTRDLWVQGRAKVEPPDEGWPYAVCEFEGPSTESSGVWEDWLHEQVRDWYDMAPRSVDLVWDYPDPSRPHGAGDLLCRTARSLSYE